MSRNIPDPEDYLDRVKDERSFVEFLSILAEDWEAEREIEKRHPKRPYSAGARGWENGTIGAFLEAAHACAVDNGISKSNKNPWRRAAEIIYCGKIYE